MQDNVPTTSQPELQIICGNLSTKPSAVSLDRAMAEPGFERVGRGQVRGFIVVPRSGNGIADFQKRLAIE